MEETIVIPGQIIDANIVPNVRATLLINPPIKLENEGLLDRLLNGQLLAPVVTATRNASNNELTIHVAFLIQKEEAIPETEINNFFNMTFSEAGGDILQGESIYKLLLYTDFNAGRSDVDTFFLYVYEIKFTSQFIPTRNSGLIDISKLKTVESTIINQNPRTSRGTVTTVQDSVGNPPFKKGLPEEIKNLL